MGNKIGTLLAVAIVTAPIAANANPVTYDFTGTVNSAYGTYGAAGSAISGSFTINFAAANPSQSSGSLGSTSATWLEQSLGGSEFGTPPPTAPVFNITLNSGRVTYSSAPASVVSQTYVSGQPGSYSEWSGTEVETSYESNSGNSFIQDGVELVGAASPVPWDTNGLPVLGNVTSQLDYLSDYVDGNEVGYLQYTIGSLTPVPPPATAWVMLTGLAGIRLMNRKRKSN